MSYGAILIISITIIMIIMIIIMIIIRMIMIKMIIIMIKIQNFNTLQLENQHGEICISEKILENS